MDSPSVYRCSNSSSSDRWTMSSITLEPTPNDLQLQIIAIILAIDSFLAKKSQIKIKFLWYTYQVFLSRQLCALSSFGSAHSLHTICWPQDGESEWSLLFPFLSLREDYSSIRCIHEETVCWSGRPTGEIVSWSSYYCKILSWFSDSQSEFEHDTLH